MGVRQKLTQVLYQLSRQEQLQYLAELDKLQWMSREEILQRQQVHLQEMLTYAYDYVPYYRDLFDQVGFKPERLTEEPESFQAIPLLTKRLIQENKDRLVTTDPRFVDKLSWKKTGGTTGEPLWFARDPHFEIYNSTHDYHIMTWSGWQLGDPQFWLWGHVPDVMPTGLAAKNMQLKDWLVRRFDSNAYIMSEESLTKLAQQIQANPKGVLWSYVSTGYRFAQFVEAHPQYQFDLRGVYVSAEPLVAHQREYMERVFGCPVIHWYASEDIGDIATESEHQDGLLIHTRNCYVEVIRDNQPVPDGEEGEFVITNLINRGMPIIRYKIEDWGRKSTRSCPSGRGLPMLEVVEGRTVDLFYTRDGRTVYGMYAKNIMPTLEGVRQFQVIQKTLDWVLFKIVADKAIPQEKLDYLTQLSKEALGEQVEVTFEFPDELPKSPTGKHRHLVSEVGIQPRDAG